MNPGADKENVGRSRSSSSRSSYTTHDRYQSRPYSSQYGGASSRYDESGRPADTGYRSNVRERYVPSDQRSSSRASGARRYETYGSRTEQRTSVRPPQNAAGSRSRYGASGSSAGGYRSEVRERYVPSGQRSYSRTSGVQRAETYSSRTVRRTTARPPQRAANPGRAASVLRDFADVFMRYLRMANADILGRRRWKLLPALYVSIACFYSEILLGLFCGAGLSGLIYKMFFSLASGLTLGGIALLFRREIQRTIVQVELSLIALLFIVQCLIRKDFQVYFPLSTIFGNATDVVGNYGGDLVLSILTGIPAIVLFALPLIVYCLKTRKHLRRSLAIGFKRIFAMQMIIVAFIMWSLGMLCLAIGGDSKVYSTEFELTSSSDTLGLLTGFRLNEKYTLFGNDAADGFEGMESMPVMTEVTPAPQTTPDPAQSAVPEEQVATDEAIAPVATQTPVATEVPLGENSLDIDFAALSAGQSNEDILAINKYLSTLSASKQNAYTGLFEGKNLIMICAEALSDAIIDPQLTPTLYRLTHNGFYFSQAYQPTWGGSTSTGEYSMLFGLVPSYSDVMQDTVGKTNYFTMASQMKRIGYNTLCYHNGSYTYYDRNVTHMNLGFDQFMAHGNGLEELAGRYPSDEKMISNTLDVYMNQQPFCVYYMTCDGHKPYDNKKDSRVTEHLQQILALYPDRYKQNTLNYISYQLELEDALATLVAKLEAAGIADDTVICICSDHYPYGLNRGGTNYIPDLYGYTPQHSWERDHNSIIIWSGSLENADRNMACEISAPTYSLDIVPTLSNLFGLEYDSRLMVGRDVFSDEIPLVLWKNGTWVTDRGRYDAEEKVFYPTAPVENEDEYVQMISNMVSYKKTYSKLVVKTDYYKYIRDYLQQKSASGAGS